jgi:acyl-CoA synthetase (AMP-forming)/AMP-acid ligase II
VGLHPAERVREYRDKGYWTDDMIDALLRARVSQFGDITAITDPLNREALLDGPFRTLTWPELDEQVSRLAQVLLAEGVGTGDVVGIQLPNTVEIVVAFLAIVRIGAIVAPFPVQYRAWELTHLSNVAQVRAFLTASRIGQRPAAAELAGLRPQIPSLRWVGVFGAGLDEQMAAADDRAGLAAHLAHFSPDPNDCVTICWTSGTESTPKGVPRTHYDWMAMCTGTVEGPDLTADDVLLNPFPMVNMAGINGMFLPWLKVGGLLVQHHPFDLATFLRQIEQHRATYTCAPPALLTALLQNEALLAQTDISSLRILGSGSAPLAPSLLQGWHDSTASRSSTSTGPTRASRCSARPRTSRTRRCGRSTSPATAPGTGSSRWPAPRWRGLWTRRPAPRSPRRACPANCASRGPACSPATCRPAACPTRSTRTATCGPGTSSRSPATTASTCATSTGPRTWSSAAG